MKQQVMWGWALTALLAGCGSNVRLDNPPVEDRTATTPLTSESVGSKAKVEGKAQADVTAVDLSQRKADQPALPKGANVVYFDYDSAVIKPDSQNVVDVQARYLKANAKQRAMLEGHTDERGGREYNLALGQRRAEAVSKALTLLGVATTQLEAVSYGKEKPAAQGKDEASLALNRRVEIKPQ